MSLVATSVLIKAKFSGQMSDTQTYLNMVIQVAGVLFLGIVVWKFGNNLHRKKMEKLSKKRLESPFSKEWRR